MSDEFNEEIPLYKGNTIIAWLKRDSINYYNVHSYIGQKVFRIGESTHEGEKIWIFDRSCFQWAEFTIVPSVLSRE